MPHKDFDDALEHYHYANSLVRSGDYADAIWHYDRIVTREWDHIDCEVFVFGSWILPTCPDASLRNPTRAIELATEACSITDWIEFWPIGALAAAYAANGNFGLAIKHQSKVIELIDTDSFVDDSDRTKHKNRLAIYNTGKMLSNDPEP